jgi:hypothetical protein
MVQTVLLEILEAEAVLLAAVVVIFTLLMKLYRVP